MNPSLELLLARLGWASFTAALRHVFLHELAHVRRHDLPVNLLATVLLALHWFNPVIWFGFRRLRHDRELAADALALDVLGESQARAYGCTIVQMLERWSAPNLQPALVGILEPTHPLTRRIQAIAGYRRTSRGFPWSAVLVAVLAAVSLTNGRSAAPSPAPTAPPDPSPTVAVGAPASPKTPAPAASAPLSSTRPTDTQRTPRSVAMKVRAVDAVTKQPVPRLRWYLGTSSSTAPDADTFQWQRLPDEPEGAELQRTMESSALHFGIRWAVVAPDGRQAASDVIFRSDQTETTLELRDTPHLTGQIVDAQGQPVAGAWISVLDLCSLTVHDGELEELPGLESLVRITGPNGRFDFACPVPAKRLAASHPGHGYTEIEVDELKRTGVVPLVPWGRIEGTFRMSDGFASGDEVALVNHTCPNLFPDRSRIDAQGRFQFARVPQGSYSLVHWKEHPGASSHTALVSQLGIRPGQLFNHAFSRATPHPISSFLTNITPTPGKVTRIEITPQGQTLQGRLAIRSDQATPDWAGFRGMLGQSQFWDHPVFASEAERRQWFEKRARENQIHSRTPYEFPIATNGTFQIANVVPGSYALFAWERGTPGRLHIAQTNFVIGPVSGQAPAQIDLGTILVSGGSVEKADRSDRSNQSDRSDRSNQSDRSDRSNQSNQSDRSDRSDQSDRSDPSDKSPPPTLRGRVVDTSGHPIAGASVQIGQRGPFADPSQGNSTATVTTDAEGRWSTTGFSGEARALSFQVTKPDFLPGWYQETEDTQPRDGAVRRSDLRDGTAEFRLTRGRALEGTVYSDRGEPVSGATVRLAFESPGGEPIQRTETDTHGNFRFVVLDNGGVQLGVDAAGFAPFESEFQVGPGMGHAQLKLRRGRSLRGRVVDGDRPVIGAGVGVLEVNSNEPLPRNLLARLVFPLDFKFSGLEAPGQTGFSRRLATTDPTGSFVLTDVPTESLVVGILAPGFAPQQQVVRTNDTGLIQVALVPDFSFTGRVLDAVSGDPIPQFTVWEAMARSFETPPESSEWLETSEEFWIRQRLLPRDSAPGRFELAHREPTGTTSRFLVMAEGYEGQPTGPIPTQGSRDHAFLLNRSKRITGLVIAPDGSPIPGADVAFRQFGKLQIQRGRLISSPQAPVALTRPDGSFDLATFLPNAGVVAMHQELGYAEIENASSDQPLRITLQPFGSIAGRIRPALLPASNLVVRVYSGSPLLSSVDFAGLLQVIPNTDGQFVLHGIPPGLWHCQISRKFEPYPIPQARDQMLIQRNLEVRPSQTADLRFGESGRTLVGQLRTPDAALYIDWPSNLGGLTTAERTLPTPRSVSPSARRNWLNRPEVRAAHLAQRHHGLIWLEEGRFRIEGVEPGNYRLALQFFEPGFNSTFSPERFKPVASLDTQIAVPTPGPGSGDEVIDLGTLTLQVARTSSTRP